MLLLLVVVDEGGSTGCLQAPQPRQLGPFVVVVVDEGHPALHLLLLRAIVAVVAPVERHGGSGVGKIRLVPREAHGHGQSPSQSQADAPAQISRQRAAQRRDRPRAPALALLSAQSAAQHRHDGVGRLARQRREHLPRGAGGAGGAPLAAAPVAAASGVAPTEEEGREEVGRFGLEGRGLGGSPRRRAAALPRLLPVGRFAPGGGGLLSAAAAGILVILVFEGVAEGGHPIGRRRHGHGRAGEASSSLLHVAAAQLGAALAVKGAAKACSIGPVGGNALAGTLHRDGTLSESRGRHHRAHRKAVHGSDGRHLHRRLERRRRHRHEGRTLLRVRRRRGGRPVLLAEEQLVHGAPVPVLLDAPQDLLLLLRGRALDGALDEAGRQPGEGRGDGSHFELELAVVGAGAAVVLLRGSRGGIPRGRVDAEGRPDGARGGEGEGRLGAVRLGAR
mmetsp:Transcript_43293/g.80455  ORF Transcript_43293/g.80455 Transcript_43293/m.80455 type:complete len:448 (-) Transcript_43293:852-2195(-)